MPLPLPTLPRAASDEGGFELKLSALREQLRRSPPMVVAVSGGVDSALLWCVAHQELGEDVLAITAVSPSLPSRELAAVEALVGVVGGRHRFVSTSELSDPRYARNPSNRCYYCKVSLWTTLGEIAREGGFVSLADGCHLDDALVHRPGRRAAQEVGVVSPLLEARFTKADVRLAARSLGLSVWDKPAMACLSSRFAYGVVITEEGLSRVDRAEDVLHGLGLGQLRVRVHESGLARIEISPSLLERALSHREFIVQELRRLGFVYVTLDLQGFRSGSMNEPISHE